MVQPIDVALSAAWRALSKLDETSGWRTIAVAEKGNCTLLAGRLFPENEEALLLTFDGNVSLPLASQLPDAQGFKVMQIPSNSLTSSLALVRQSHGHLEFFTRMASDVVNTIVNNEFCSNDVNLHLFLGRIRAWQAFMKKGHESLSTEAELGLVGELECLDQLLATGLLPHTVLQGWIGPLDGIQDFELGHGAIEVKSTLAHQGFTAKIFSLDQLDDANRQPLFVYGCRFAIHSTGLTLVERINEIRSKLLKDLAAGSLFESLLIAAGYLDAHADCYTRQFLVRDTYFWLVDELFPRLIASNVSLRVRRAEYEIDLSSLQNDQTTINEVIKMLGAV